MSLVGTLPRLLESVQRMTYHRKGRAILDDPFYWSCDNEFAPHGNDTGADLLHAYREWNRQHRQVDSMVFFDLLMTEWEMTEADEMGRSVRDEAAVALAFAEVKVRGACSPAVCALALNAVQRQRDEAIKAIDWRFRDECLLALQKVEGKLQQMSERPPGGARLMVLRSTANGDWRISPGGARG